MKLFKLLIYLSLSCLLFSCNGGLFKYIPLSVDQNLGLMNKEYIDANPFMFKLLDESKHPKIYENLNKIRDKILASGKLEHKEDFQWELKVIDDDSTLNAFCLPGGYIYVYTGLIKFLESEDALAGVLGHEMAHADLRHGTNQMIKNSGLSFVIQIIFGVDNSALVNIGANLLSLSFSRSDESEADMKSVEYLYATDYDARGGSKFFEKLQTDREDPGVVEFISTHPNPENRVQSITDKWQLLGGKKGETYEEEYQALKKELR